MATSFVLLFFICCAIVLFHAKTNAQELVSPCPRLFVYEPKGSESDRWYGIITLISDWSLSGVWLRITLDSPSIQLGNWFGEVKMLDPKEYLIKNRNFELNANSPYLLRFYIKYDPSKPVPRLESFRWNGRTVCPEVQTSTDEAESTTSSLSVPPAPPMNRPVPTNDNRPSFTSPVSEGNNSNVNSDVQCGTIAVQAIPLITYGQKTEVGEFPWHAALYHSQEAGLNYKCGGALISQLHVLTVVGCVSSSKFLLNPDNLLVYLGKYNLKKWSNPSIQERQVSRIVKHPHFDSRTYANNIAVITLSQPAEFTDFVRPICLWEGSKGDISQLIGKQGTVVGWGYDENGKLRDELTMINMPIVSAETCIYSFPDFFSKYTNSETFCAGYKNGTSLCNGDSGGGMVFLKDTGNPNKKVYQIRGLVSVAVSSQYESKCDPKHYVVFTDVPKYLSFIRQAMRGRVGDPVIYLDHRH